MCKLMIGIYNNIINNKREEVWRGRGRVRVSEREREKERDIERETDLQRTLETRTAR